MTASGGPKWTIAPFDGSRHVRAAFGCGVAALDAYLKERATQDTKRDLARVFVATERDDPVVCGFYTLSAAAVRRDGLPISQARRLPDYPIPAALLGRLAVDVSHRGARLGARLLVDALKRVHHAASTIGIRAILVDAKDDAAASFYGKFGFQHLSASPLRLFLAMKTIRQLVEDPNRLSA